MAWLPWKRSPEREGSSYALGRLHSEVDRLFDRFFEDFGLEPFGREFHRGGWLPAVDVSESEEEITVKADIPGITPENLDIQIKNDVLTLRGETREEKEEKGMTYHRIERRSGTFQRSLALPSSVEVEKVSASHKDGVLMIRLPKREEEKPRSITINVE